MAISFESSLAALVLLERKTDVLLVKGVWGAFLEVQIKEKLSNT